MKRGALFFLKEERSVTKQLAELDLTIKRQQATIERFEQMQLDQELIKYHKNFLSEFSKQFSSYEIGQDFFNSFVLYLAELTMLDYVFIGELKGDGIPYFDVTTTAITAFGKLVGNIEYPAANGPCEQVIKGKIYNYPESCRQIFPKNQTLVDFKVEGYLGYPLFNSDNKAMGLIAFMHQKAIEDPETFCSVLRIAAKRAEIEMEKIKIRETMYLKNIDPEKNTSDMES